MIYGPIVKSHIQDSMNAHTQRVSTDKQSPFQWKMSGIHNIALGLITQGCSICRSRILIALYLYSTGGPMGCGLPASALELFLHA